MSIKEISGQALGPVVSVIIVSMNGAGFIKNCLDTLFAQTFTRFEVIFVDNGSVDGSAEAVKKGWPSVIVMENPSNYGFARANNQGIRKARGRYVLTLNNDTELDPRFIENLVKTAEGAERDAGMWAPKILSLERKDEIDSVGGLLIYPDGLARGRGRLQKDVGQFDSVEEVFMPSACAALYRKEMLDSIGLFDDDFFAYCEDTDLGLRARLAGWKAWSAPTAKVYHYYSGTGGRYSPFKAYLVERNHCWVALKNFPLQFLLIAPFYGLWRYIVQLSALVKGKGAAAQLRAESSFSSLVYIIIKAYLHAVAGLVKMLGKRRAVQAMRRATSAEVAGWFGKFGISAREVI